MKLYSLNMKLCKQIQPIVENFKININFIPFDEIEQ
jgi:hypothetical protein